MSRTPFPTRRPKSPANQNVDLTANTLPLSFSRQPARSMTPSSSTGSMARGGSPARPLRSDLRTRQPSQYSMSSSSSQPVNRDSMVTTPTDSVFASRPSGERPRIDQQDSRGSPAVALSAALSAFQQAGARKRAATIGSMDREKEREQQQEEEMQRQKRIREKMPGRRPNGKSKATGYIDAVLDRIEDDWAFVTEPEFNPVDLALQLLDSDSAGKDIDSFKQTKTRLARALKGSVDKHYQAFAAALPHHAALLSHLGKTQAQVVEARTALQEAKDALSNKRSDLVQLWSRGQTIEEMLRLLGEIDHLKTVPDALESLMSEKRLLQASVLLVRSLKTINKPEMSEIGAVSDLRSYLTGQENALREILIDELHSHLFLKSFWCDSRWSAYAPSQHTLPFVDFDKTAANNDASLATTGSGPVRLKRFLSDLATRANDPPLGLDESDLKSGRNRLKTFSVASLSSLTSAAADIDKSSNPESDSFGYLETLLESLSVLGKLGNALDSVSQRIPSEVYSLVETTVDEVYERAEIGRRLSVYAAGIQGRPSSVYVFAGETGVQSLQSGFVDATSLRLAALESIEKQVDHEVLRDLFWTLYSKLDAVIQGLRVVYEVANRIGSRREFKDSSGAKPGALFPLVDIWQPIQTEIRTLLGDYLNDEEKGPSTGRNPISSINEVLREGKFTRDRLKSLFRFGDTDQKSTTKSLKSHEEELTQVLKETVPGLVQGNSDSAVQTNLSRVGSEDRMSGVEHHRLLIRPDAFHVSIIFHPTLTFLERAANVLPSGLEATRASTELLDDFVLHVYLPQLEEKSSMLFHHIVTSHDAFQVDQASLKLCSEPLLKATTQLTALINSLCAMLRTTPFHRENYSRLILSIVIQFYQRCSDRFFSVVSQEEFDMQDRGFVLSAKWAQRVEISPCLSEMLEALNAGKEDSIGQSSQQETRIESEILTSETVAKGDFIESIQNLSFLATLYRSITWLVEQLERLKASTASVISPSESISSPTFKVLPTFSVDEALSLPLSKEMELRFDALLKTYDQLAKLILYTIRLDLRCRVIYYLNAAMRHGNYRIDREDGEPDPHIIDLNADLSRADECMSTALPPTQRTFAFVGIEALMEELLISNARHVRAANVHGIKKILRNILALRQNIKTLISYPVNTEFERARSFYSLFADGPQALLESARKQHRFSFDSYKAMLSLQCGVDQSQGQPGGSQATNKDFNMYIIELHALELDHSNGPDL